MMPHNWSRGWEASVEDTLLPDRAKDAHDAIERIIDAHGWTVHREWEVPDRGDGRRGFIDLVAFRDEERIAVEIDRRSPRVKSIRKLNALRRRDPTWATYVILRSPPSGMPTIREIL